MNIVSYFFTFLIASTFISNSVKAENYQYYHQSGKEISAVPVDNFMPITFSPTGMESFFTKIYNSTNYGTDFLPNNFMHLQQFLNYGLDTQQPSSYIMSVFKLFGNKVKAASYVNAYAFSEMLNWLHKPIGGYFKQAPPVSKDELKVTINDVLYSSFLSQFEFFKKDPQNFFNDLSHEILTSLNHELLSANKEIKQEQLRQSIIRFLEVCLSKIIWSPQEPEEAWDSVKLISQQLASLMDSNILVERDRLDDLCWSLVHRVCLFVDIAGTNLPLDFYDKVKQDLNSKELVFCEIEEQEKLITKKSDVLLQAFASGEAKTRAYQSGILVR